MSETQARSQRFASFREFYPFYLSEHQDRNCRRLHFAGLSLALAFIVTAIATRNAWWLLAALLCGYGFAWVGHFVFERNIPATLRHPILAGVCDMIMYRKMWRGEMDVEIARYAPR